MRFLQKISILVLLAIPFSVSALTAAELQVQVSALLQQVQALQAQLAAQAGGTTAGSATGSNAVFCPGINRSLKLGSTGDDVARLQQFLASPSAGGPAIYPEAKVTGYYGALTEAAVQRWQVKFNIVSSGTPATTGYGVVGPRTAAAIAVVCGGGTYNGISGTVVSIGTADAGAVVGGFIKVTPVQGGFPLNVSIEATINTTKSCAATVYVLDYGDQSTPQLLPLTAGACDQQVYALSHIYTSAGTFTITLSAEGHKTSVVVQVTSGTSGNTVGVNTGTNTTDTNIATTTSATFYGTTTAVSSTTSAYGRLVVTPGISGDSLTVQVQFDLPECPAFALDWDDDSTLVTSNTTQCSPKMVLNHTYVDSGAYTIVLKRSSRTDRAQVVIWGH